MRQSALVRRRHAFQKRLQKKLTTHKPIVVPDFNVTRHSLHPNDGHQLLTNKDLQYEYLTTNVNVLDLIHNLPSDFVDRYIAMRYYHFDSFLRYRSHLAKNFLEPLAIRRYTRMERRKQSMQTIAFANVQLIMQFGIPCGDLHITKWQKWWLYLSNGLRYQMCNTDYVDRFLFGTFVVHDVVRKQSELSVHFPVNIAMTIVCYDHVFCTINCECMRDCKTIQPTLSPF